MTSESAAYAAALGEALDVLLDASAWQLPETRWPAIEQILDAMQAALESRDLDALAAATIDLELAGPMRLIKIGAGPVKPPRPTRYRLNRLVHAVGGTTPGEENQCDAGKVAGHDSIPRQRLPGSE